MAELNDVRVFGFIGPPDSTDTFASHYAFYGRGGWRTIATHAERNDLTVLTPDRCEQGMVVITLDDGVAWQLGPEPWLGSDADWSIFSLGVVLSPRQSCKVATAAALTATYANGTLGVGATLTNSGTQAAIAIDGVTLALTNRVLVKDQATPAQNGLFTVTTLGSGASNWVLTRATDYDQASEVDEGTYTIVVEGTANNGTLWIEGNVGPFVIGTTPITWIKLNTLSLPITLTGPITGSGTGTVATTIANAAVTYFKLQDEAGLTLLGNPTGSSAAPSEVTLRTGLTFSGTDLAEVGGWRTVADHAARNDLTVSFPDLCVEGMVVVTLSDGASWQLLASPWDGTDANWVVITTLGPLAVHSFLLGGGADLEVADDVAAWYVILPIAGTFTQFDLSAKVGPVGADAIFDLKLSTNYGSTWTSLWATTPGNRPTIAAGSNNATGTTFETPTFPAGSWLRADVKQVGSTTAGQGVNLALTVTYTG